MIHMDVDIHSPGPHSPSFRSMRQYSGKRTRSPEPSSPIDRPSVRLFLSPRLLLYAKWLILTYRKGFLWRLAFQDAPDTEQLVAVGKLRKIGFGFSRQETWPLLVRRVVLSLEGALMKKSWS
jgi:hypothetical protein